MEYKKASWVDHIGGQHYSNELILCPNCGSKAMVRMMGAGDTYVRCTNEYCQHETPLHWEGSDLEGRRKAEREAIKEWNEIMITGDKN